MKRGSVLTLAAIMAAAVFQVLPAGGAAAATSPGTWGTGGMGSVSCMS